MEAATELEAAVELEADGEVEAANEVEALSYRPDLAVLFEAQIPRSWTETHLADALNFKLLQSNRKRDEPNPVVLCQRSSKNGTRDNEFYVEVREQKDWNRLLELDNVYFSCGTFVIRPRVEPWERKPVVPQRHKETERGKEALRGSISSYRVSKEKADNNNNDAWRHHPQHHPQHHQSNDNYSGNDSKKNRTSNTDNSSHNNNRDDGDDLDLGEISSKRPKITKTGAATTNQHHLSSPMSEFASAYDPSQRIRHESSSKEKALLVPPPNWNDENCVVFLSKKPNSMTWDEIVYFINSSIKKMAIFDDDVIVNLRRYKTNCSSFLCSSAFAAQTIVERLDGVVVKSTTLTFRRHRDFQKHQRQQYLETANDDNTPKKGSYTVSANIGGSKDTFMNDTSATCSLLSRTGPPPLTLENCSAKASTSDTTRSKNTASDTALDTFNDIAATIAATTDITKAEATATSKISTSDSGTERTPLASRFLFCRLAGTTKPVQFDNVVSFLNKAIVGKHQIDQNVIVRTEACGHLLYRLESDTEESATKLIALSGIVYDGTIKLNLTREQRGDDESLRTYPSLSSPTEDELPDCDKGTIKDDDRSTKDDFNRVVFAKPVKRKGIALDVGYDINDVRSFLISMLKKYGFSKLHNGSENSMMSCCQVKNTVVITMATPQLALALMNFNKIHWNPWTIHLTRHKDYKGQRPRFHDVQHFTHAYRLDSTDATTINDIENRRDDAPQNPGTECSTMRRNLLISDKTAKLGNSDTENQNLIIQLKGENEKLMNDLIKLLKENKTLRRRNESVVKLENNTATFLPQSEIGPGTHDQPIELVLSDNYEGGDGIHSMVGKNEYDEMKTRYENVLSELEKSKLECDRQEKELAITTNVCRALEKEVNNAANTVNQDYKRRIEEIHESWREQNQQIEEQEQMIQTLQFEVETKGKSIDELTSKLQVCHERQNETIDALTRATRLYDEEREARKELTVDVVRLKKSKKLAEKRLKGYEVLGNREEIPSITEGLKW
eukprot:jgi/Psemu1/328010/estExt_fgenesh1_pg.C_9380001